VIATQPVVENSAEELGNREGKPLSTCLSVPDRRSGQRRKVGLATAQSSDRQRPVGDRGDPGRFGGRSKLLLERRGSIQLAVEGVHAAAIGEDKRQRGQRPRLSDEVELPRRQRRPRRVV